MRRMIVLWAGHAMSNLTAVLLGNDTYPQNARRTKGDSQKAISSVGGKDELLRVGLCLGFIMTTPAELV
jgi:hypothetical protein